MKTRRTLSLFTFTVSAAMVLGAAGSALADRTAPTTVTCEEKLPEGATRPKLTETFPGEAVAGHEARLEIVVTHGRGETVLPNGFKVVPGSDMEKALAEAGFAVAEASGGSPPKVDRQEGVSEVTTNVVVPFVLLPTKSGKASLTLPQMPLTVGRANGETMTVCTQMHLVTASDPTAGEESPKPHPNPPPRPQIEDWPLMKWILAGVVLLLVLAAITAWWVRKQLRKPVPAAESLARLPWEEALSELEEIRRSPLLVEGPYAELYDRASDVVRKYLGARYGFSGLGFEGLDTTTDEMLTLLKRVRPQVPSLDVVRKFLEECDLVKFARVEPSRFACGDALQMAEDIVRATTPVAPAPGSSAEPPADAPPPGGPTPPPPPAAPPPPEARAA
ncbi:MAG: hypothetical protein JNL21_41090 [Myxococcales bacterium]|nr:hypothetical protein [Myxococcales bacterium]